MNLRKPSLMLAALLLSALFAFGQQPAHSGKHSDKQAAAQPAQAASGAKLDINTASKDDLEKLPGIGPVTAQKIIDGRPYRAKSDLVSKKIVGQKEYAKIKDQIIAHQATATKK